MLALNVYSALIWITSTIIFSFSAILFFMNNKRSSRSLVVISLSLTLWTAALGGIYAATTNEMAIWFVRMAHFTGSLIAVSTYLFLYFLHDDSTSTPRRTITTLVLLEICLSLAYFMTNGFVEDVQHVGPDILARVIVNGPYAPLQYVYTFGLITLGAIKVYRKQYTSTHDREHTRNILVVLSAIFGAIGISLIATRAFGFERHYWIVPLIALLWVPGTAYSLIKYNVVPYRLFVGQVAALAMAVLVFADIFITEGIFDIVGRIFVFIFFSLISFFFVRLLSRNEQQRAALAESAETLSKLNVELEDANKRLKILDEQRSKFISIASHQLRAPLTAIIGYSSMLLENSYGKIPKKATIALQKVFRSGRNLMGTINDFLDASTLESGQLHFSFTPLELTDLIKSLVEEMRGNVEFAGLTLSFNIDTEKQIVIYADKDKLRHVVTNLIDNAIHYTHKGSIAVSVDTRGNNAVLTVTDTGMGISKETLASLFKKFSRGTEAQQHSAEGVGLGLYLAKEIVRAHKGTIRAESEGVGKGSRFVIEIPLADSREIDSR